MRLHVDIEGTSLVDLAASRNKAVESRCHHAVGRDRLIGMGTVVWGREVAQAYDETSGQMFDPATLDPAVDRLAALAGAGPVLELALGTGRVALPLRARGLDVHGIELSPHMVDALRAKAGGEDVPVVVGDMATATVPGEFSLVCLVWNGIMNVTTQAEQVAVFRNARRHLAPGGRFVVEVIVPQVHTVPPGSPGRVFQMDPHHVGVETFDDRIEQIAWSHHWMQVDGQLVHHAAPYRYVWPAELDLMAQLADLEPEHRWADWHGTALTGDADQIVAVYRRPA